MNEITFRAKLKIDPNLNRTLKRSNPEKIITEVESFVQSPKISKLLDKDEIILSPLKNPRGDGVLINVGKEKIQIKSKGEITQYKIIEQILLYLCAKFGIKPKTAAPKEIINAFKKIPF